MLRASYLLDDTLKKISRMGKSLSANSDLTVLKNRLRFEYRNAITFFIEMISIVDYFDVNMSFNNFKIEVDEILALDNWEEIKTRLTNIAIEIGFDWKDNLDKYDLNFNEKQHEYDYSIAPVLAEQDLKRIARSISSPGNRPINFLDARCKDGVNSDLIAKNTTININLYGMEQDTNCANNAKDKNIFTKIAKGGLNGSKCSNDVFDVTLLYPKLKYEAEYTPMQTLKPRVEVEELRQVTKYLRKDGLLIMAIPSYRLTSQMCTVIAKNYDNISVMRGTSLNKLVIICGIKKVEESPNEDNNYNLLREIGLLEDTSSLEINNLNKYIVPADLLEVSIFRGNILDDEDITDIITNTGLYDSFIDKQSNILESLENQQPLLPFNIGQIGLVLTSGCLDGEIEEIDGQYHVIKGMVKKEEITEKVDGERRGETETRTTFVNKVQINVIAPDGTFKTLA